MRYLFLFLVLFSLQGGAQNSNAHNFVYVATDGDDNNPGTFNQPVKTIGKAQQLVRTSKKYGATVYIRGGEYRMTKPVVFTPEDSGTEIYPVAYKAYPGEIPVFLGSKALALKWKKGKGGVYTAKVDKTLDFERLYANGEKQILARYPNYNEDVLPFNGWAEDAIAPERIKTWKRPEGAYLHVLHGAQWGGYHYRITGVDNKGEVILEGGWQNNRPEKGMHKKFRFVENIKEELDTINEWYLDKEKNTLYWKPSTGVNLKNVKIEVPQTKHLIEIKGTEANPVKHLHIEGIHFKHSTRTFMEADERLLRSDWAIYRGGAVFIDGVEHVSVKHSNFEDLGGNAVFVNDYARKVEISHNRITRIGASAICFVGDTTAVRSPVFGYSEYVTYEDMDKVIGPKNNLYPANCIAHDNLIFDFGQIEKQTAGVQIDMAMSITASHNSIYKAPRAGINVGDGTWGGHIIEYNDVFNTVRETSDHGSFNSWGRDRFWSSSRERVNAYVKEHPELPLLDAIKTTHIRNNRFRCDHGWDIDLDDGSTNYEVYNNLCLSNGIKLREGFYRKAFNNITVNNSMHMHVWYDNSGDLVYNNIFGAWYWTIRLPEVWGTMLDYNLFDMTEKPIHLNDGGRDTHSIIGNPQFLDPAKGDYRIAPTSPALALGVHNFDMDNFGVVSEHLKAEAETPVLPKYTPGLNAGEEPKRDNTEYDWMGGKVKNLVGMGEVSSTGMHAEIGVILTSVPKDSKMGELGFKEGDVIFEWWGGELENVKILLVNYKSRPRGHDIPVTVLRNQAKVQLHVN
ncbi:right-handed parallel beta-helix repeat-containing protein [Tamlana sp. 2201CG12-4]|uniref:right-handed parallel beta-helix repeat-containing protein n=1 Tax=Tamlana sp. 2201CG12-4 TaxID=3112582 RepID=UPI002DB7F9CD|nr:right-handed parallel beta-helix repeat-containing protein [Tamlana sp. 2201CG12-4]MEC3908505.1 right-handed parallel beta-helix repeat-containing protein [Tamlana sp. 2201CG12-4]